MSCSCEEEKICRIKYIITVDSSAVSEEDKKLLLACKCSCDDDCIKVIETEYYKVEIVNTTVKIKNKTDGKLDFKVTVSGVNSEDEQITEVIEEAVEKARTEVFMLQEIIANPCLINVELKDGGGSDD